MSGKLIALTLAYAFSIFVLLLLLIRSRLSMAVRLSVVLAGAVFYLLHYFSLSSLQGWPSSARLPKHSRCMRGSSRNPILPRINRDTFIFGFRPRSGMCPARTPCPTAAFFTTGLKPPRQDATRASFSKDGQTAAAQSGFQIPRGDFPQRKKLQRR